MTRAHKKKISTSFFFVKFVALKLLLRQSRSPKSSPYFFAGEVKPVAGETKSIRGVGQGTTAP